MYFGFNLKLLSCQYLLYVSKIQDSYWLFVRGERDICLKRLSSADFRSILVDILGQDLALISLRASKHRKYLKIHFFTVQTVKSVFGEAAYAA